MHYLSEDEFLCNNPDTPVYNLEKWSNYIKSKTALSVVEVQNLLNDAHEDVKKVDGKTLLFGMDLLTSRRDQGPWLLSEPKFGTGRSETQIKLTPRFCKKEYELEAKCSRSFYCSVVFTKDIEGFCQALGESLDSSTEDGTIALPPEAPPHFSNAINIGELLINPEASPSTEAPPHFSNAINLVELPINPEASPQFTDAIDIADLPNFFLLESVPSPNRVTFNMSIVLGEQTTSMCNVITANDRSGQEYIYNLDFKTEQSLSIAVQEERMDGLTWQRLHCVTPSEDPAVDLVTDLEILTGARSSSTSRVETTSTHKGTKSGLWNCTIVSCSRGKYLLNDTCLEPRLLTVTMDLPTERPVNATVSVNDLVAELRRAILAYPGMKVTNLGERVLSDSGTNKLVMHFQISGVFDRDTDSQFPISGHVWIAVSTYLSLPAMPGAIHLCLMSPGPDEKIIGTRCNWIKAREIDNKEVVVGGNSSVNPFLKSLANAKIEIGSGNCSSVVTNGSSISQCSTSNQATEALSDGDGKNGASSSLTSIWSSPRPDNLRLTPTVTLAMRILVIMAMTSTGLTESGIIPRSLHPF